MKRVYTSLEAKIVKEKSSARSKSVPQKERSISGPILSPREILPHLDTTTPLYSMSLSDCW